MTDGSLVSWHVILRTGWSQLSMQTHQMSYTDTCMDIKVDVDECASSPCRNGGECRDKRARFHCFCTHGFTGETCDIEINACLSNPCQNAGSCSEEPGRLVNQNRSSAVWFQICWTYSHSDRFRCDCVAGFVGARCEVETNECSSTPCDNGGRCVDLVNRFICECPAGYKGIMS